ncbi:hypothetical protein [Miniphocaeibacter massiliensis]|uniref:hypothetical protein n=1 Tax=Miniphocaeibacter massiliensis TaxID=2041841 RepID=UPI000C07E629|nr:hypothetical protein [Miniphocaeibacter massiliensis]
MKKELSVSRYKFINIIFVSVVIFFIILKNISDYYFMKDDRYFAIHMLISVISIVFTFAYVIVMFVYFARMETTRNKVFEDELTREYEAKATSYAVVVFVILAIIALFVAMINGGTITVGVDFIMSFVLMFSAIKDGIYLYLEKKDI